MIQLRCFEGNGEFLGKEVGLVVVLWERQKYDFSFQKFPEKSLILIGKVEPRLHWMRRRGWWFIRTSRQCRDNPVSLSIDYIERTSSAEGDCSLCPDLISSTRLFEEDQLMGQASSCKIWKQFIFNWNGWDLGRGVDVTPLPFIGERRLDWQKISPVAEAWN